MPERWEEVEGLFAAALALAPEERAAFLATRSSDDPALAAEMESLVAADAASGSFLGGPDVAPAGASRDCEPGGGDRIGPYELLRELGRGGSGVVFLARRLDLLDAPEVALKMLHADSSWGPRGRVLERRFRTEWKILASLEHPHLARLLDVGATGSGAPYFVMENVKGVPLDRYCDRERLSIEARLRLFVTVCETVELAHRHRIVHRDVKPANILVTADGTPKLLDFGIAKLLDPEALTQQEATGTWVRVLTPQYASPEQVLGQAIGPASDVYSLGVLLFLLLTGCMPMGRLPTASFDEVAGRLAERRPPRPSTAVLPERGRCGEEAAELAGLRGLPPAALSRRLAGDLDAIVARALAREPRRRYLSAGALAADLRNHLAGAAVEARPPWLLALARSPTVRQSAAAALLLCGLGLGTAVSVDVEPARLGGDARARRASAAEAARCIPDGGVDDTLLSTDCCSGVAVHGSTVCQEAADWGTSWSSCQQLCGTRPVTCIPVGGVDDTLTLTDCCSGAAVPGSTQCLDPADFGTTWRSCVQTCA